MSTVGYQAKPLSRINIRHFATSVRGALGYADRPRIDFEEVFDFILPHVLPDFCYEVHAHDLMGNNHGLADPVACKIVLREDVYERACEGHGRDRLTAFHELAHVLLHGPDRIVMRRGEGSPVAYCDPEWQANCFAGELLVAHTLVKRFANPFEAASGFAVSQDAARYQWKAYQRDGIL